MKIGGEAPIDNGQYRIIENTCSHLRSTLVIGRDEFDY